MSYWPSKKAKQVYAALRRLGWHPDPNDRGGSSHQQLLKDGWDPFTWAFHDGEEIGPKMMARIAKRTGLRAENL